MRVISFVLARTVALKRISLELSELTIKIKHIPTRDVAFLAVSDSAWANSPDLCSQAGFMVAAIDKKMVKNAWGDFSLLRWKSF